MPYVASSSAIARINFTPDGTYVAATHDMTLRLIDSCFRPPFLSLPPVWTETRVKKFLLDTSGSPRKTIGNCCQMIVRITADKSKLDSCSSVTSCAVRLPSTLAQ